MSKVTTLDLEKYLFGQEQPAAVDLEAAVLGAIMLDKDAYMVVRDAIGPEQMYDDRHALIMKVFDNLDRDGAPIDLLTVTEGLKRAGVIEAVGGPHYLVELTGRVGSSANIEHHAMIIRQCWIQRELIKLAAKTIKSSYAREDVFKILGRIDSGLLKVSSFKSAGEISLHEATMEASKAALERLERGSDILGESLFGIGPLDRAINGMEMSDVISIFGSPGSGKTSLITSILVESCIQKRRAWFWTPETHTTRISEKFSSHVLDMPVSDVRIGKHLSDPAKLKLIEDRSRDYVVLRNSPLDIPTMKRRVKTEFLTHGTKLFIFDRLELFSEATGDFSRIAAAVTDITKEMRGLATEYGIGFVPLSQMLKEHAGKPPKLAYVYGGTLMQGNLTKALGVHQPGKYGKELESGGDAKGMGEIHIAKNNYGEEGVVELNFDGPKQKWYSADEQLDNIPKGDTPFG